MKKINIPNIRFTTFLNPWDIKNLKQIGTIKKGQQINKLNLKEIGKYYVLNGGISPSGYLDRYNTPMNTISISEGGNSCGFVTLNKKPFWSGGHNYTLFNLNIDTDYLFQYLKKQEQFIMTLRTGSGLPNIQKSRLENIIILFPQKEEQLKLSKLFLDIDVLIQQQKIKLEYLNNLKKTMLEKMFPKENSNIPELRFKDFTDVWEQRELGEVVESVKNGYSYKADGSRTHRYKTTRIETISTGEINVEKLGSSESINEAYKLLDGDILFSHINSLPYIANTAIYTADLGEIYHGMNLLNIRSNKQLIDSFFLLYLLKREDSREWFRIVAKPAVNQCSIATSDVVKFTFSMPNLNEQKKISTYFRNLDSLLVLHQRKLEKYKQIKQALMDKMFV